MAMFERGSWARRSLRMEERSRVVSVKVRLGRCLVGRASLVMILTITMSSR